MIARDNYFVFIFELRNEFNEFMKVFSFIVPGKITSMDEEIALRAFLHQFLQKMCFSMTI